MILGDSSRPNPGHGAVYNRQTFVTKIIIAAAVLVAILYGFWGYTRVLPGGVPAFASLALLLATLWSFGFGLGKLLSSKLRSRSQRLLAPALLVIPYLVFAIPMHEARWSIFAAMIVTAIASAAILETCPSHSRLAWQDVVVLLLLLCVHLLRLFEPAWPDPRLAVLPKLFLIDIVAYLYTVVRPLERIGYSLVPAASAFRIGFREWLFFLPFGIGLGTALHFTHFRPHLPALGQIGVAIVVTFLFVAIPEELFFRGILQNLLESRIGQTAALVLASVLFGLSHYHRGGAFDERYIVLAAIAGIFYGRAWRARHQLLAAIITHTAVDVVWSIWFR